MDEAVFKWNKEFSLGIDQVDRQHKGLVELINKAILLSMQSNRISLEDLAEMEKDLVNYATEHFDTEEAMMKANGLDGRHVDQHKKIHEDFKANVVDMLKDKVSLTEPKAFAEVPRYLVRWLAYHILKVDRLLAEQIKLIQHGVEPEEAYLEATKSEDIDAEPLLEALEALFEIVARKNKELREANSVLEEKVMQRTVELQAINEKLLKMSMVDELTGLYNRRYATTKLQELIHEYKRYGETFSLVYLDIDDFKSVNDTYGHEKGDDLLKWFSAFMKNTLRVSDIPCRLGGDEFLIICGCCDLQSALSLGSKLNPLCTKAFQAGGMDYWKPSLSVGVGEIDTGISTASEMLRLADHAMYEAKKDGGGRVAVVTESPVDAEK